VRYTQRLADQGAVASVGSRGDSYDNALAEAVNGPYRAELIGPRGPWRTAEQVELATLEWVQWWNQRRLHGALDHLPPAEHEALYNRQHQQSKEVAQVQPPRPPSNQTQGSSRELLCHPGVRADRPAALAHAGGRAA
jgi:Integrase core domain